MTASSPLPITRFRYPRAWQRRLIARLLALLLIVMILALIAELALVFSAGPLLCGLAFLTALLMIPVIMRTVLHPEIEVTADGLRLYPMWWPAQSLAWADLIRIIPHPLVYNDPAMGRTLHGKNYRPRQGIVILVANHARLWPVYRLIGNLSGAGNTLAFAISSTTHTDYAILLETVQRHIPTSEPD